MNVIEDAWIPVTRKSGRTEKIAPWQITGGEAEDPIVELSPPRPDFRGALIQFLIGLVQTAAAPKGPRDWPKSFDSPPQPEQLRALFAPLIPFFQVDGEGPRFMQDFQLEQNVVEPVERLLVDAPGKVTIEDNRDIFVKRGSVEWLCLPCASLALFTLQTNAPLGGPGFRTGLRGGGPLTTVALGKTLWQTVWLNVLEEDRFLALCGNSEKNQESDRFPWLAATRTSEKVGGQETQPSDVHPYHIFWSMPRRIRLVIKTPIIASTCPLCEDVAQQVVAQFQNKNYGTNYTGPWLHPLTPHYRDKEGMLLPIHVQPGGVSWHHWMGMISSMPGKTAGDPPARLPAATLHILSNDRAKSKKAMNRVWAFGYDMDNMKARCWYDGTLPLLAMEKEDRQFIETTLSHWIKGAQHAVDILNKQLKSAWFSRPADARGDFSFVARRFWQESESDFYQLTAQLIEQKEEELEAVYRLTKTWHGQLKTLCNAIFDDLSQNTSFDTINPRRSAKAWNTLQKELNSKQMLVLLGLPLPEKTLKKEPIP